MSYNVFPNGRPYSRGQITNLLRETWFTPTGWGEALYVPPIARTWFLRSSVAKTILEKYGFTFLIHPTS